MSSRPCQYPDCPKTIHEDKLTCRDHGSLRRPKCQCGRWTLDGSTKCYWCHTGRKPWVMPKGEDLEAMKRERRLDLCKRLAPHLLEFWGN